MSPISGYTYSNTFKKWTFNYDGPLLNTSFNTVQGWNSSVGFSYGTNDEDKRTYSRISTRLSYGFAEDKFRATASYIRKFNNNDNSTLFINGGSLVSQFNGNNPISKNSNMISSLLFVNNYMKLYEKLCCNFFRQRSYQWCKHECFD